MNVLSLFDGISCGKVALERAGLYPDCYFASEIDKYAIAIAQWQFGDTDHIGAVQEVTAAKLPEIDLLIGGSPCQGFSNAGKGMNFDDPRSKLFFEFVRLLNETKPRYFLLENVRMKPVWQDVISSYLGVEPIMINSALVSAQNRVRLYWTNIPDVEQPKDKHIYLRDIIENGWVDREKSYAIDAHYGNGGSYDNYFNRRRRQLVFDSEETYNHVLRVGTASDISGHDYNKRIYSVEGKSPTLNSASGGNIIPKIAISSRKYRALTPLECERCQTLPDNYTAVPKISKTQRYKTLGNGWTAEVISHIFRSIPK